MRAAAVRSCWAAVAVRMGCCRQLFYVDFVCGIPNWSMPCSGTRRRPVGAVSRTAGLSELGPGASAGANEGYRHPMPWRASVNTRRDRQGRGVPRIGRQQLHHGNGIVRGRRFRTGVGRQWRRGTAPTANTRGVGSETCRCSWCGQPFADFPGTEDSIILEVEVRAHRRVIRRRRYRPSCSCGAHSGIVMAPPL